MRRWFDSYYETNGRAYTTGRYDEARADAALRRRVQIRGGEVERFSRLEVFARDDWTCGLCDSPVDPTLTFPDPASASLDHIAPVSLGGAHTRANTRLAHLGCNASRGNREVA